MNRRRQRDRDAPPREPPILSGRVPPNDLGAEAVVLSAALLEREALEIVLEVLEPAHFYSDNHRLILEAAKALMTAGEPVDIVSVASWLRGRELIQRAGGAKYLGEVVDGSPAVAPSSLRSHAEHVHRLWQRRRVISVCQKYAGEGYGDIGHDGVGLTEAHDRWIAECERELFGVTRRRSAKMPRPIGPIVTEEVAAYDDDPDKRKSSTKVLTHLEKYDEEIGGMWGGDLIVLAARPGMGKSALATSILRLICGEVGYGIDVEDPSFVWTPEVFVNEGYVWSGEMPEVQVGQRILCQESTVSTKKVRHRGQGKHKFSDSERRKVDQAAKRLEHMPIIIDDTPGISVLEFCSKVRRAFTAALKRGRRLKIAVADYLQKMTWPGRVSSRDEYIGKICGELKNLAMELGIPVIALCQLNRTVESRTNKRPLLSDLRESGNIEQDADQVGFLYRDHYYSRKADHREAEWIFAKNRMGETGTIEIGFWNWCTRFMNFEDALPRCAECDVPVRDGKRLCPAHRPGGDGIPL